MSDLFSVVHLTRFSASESGLSVQNYGAV